MRYLKIFLFALFFAPSALFAASDFEIAAQLLSAAKNADIQQVQVLVNSGADVNYVDNTGLSIVCTALMNNDLRAAQILQMYGADASRCDQQIKKYNQRLPKTESGGLFSGLSSAQSIALAAAGAAVVVGGLFLLTDLFDPGNSNSGGGGGSGSYCRPNAACTCANGSSGICQSDGTCNCSGGGGGGGEVKLTLPYGPAMPNAESETANYVNNLNQYSPSTEGITKDNFIMMTDNYKQNYLLMMHGYSPLARGYLGMRTLRNSARAPINLSGNNLGPDPVLGGRPVNVAMVTTNGINAAGKPAGEISQTNSSLDDVILPWTTTNNNGEGTNGGSNDMISSKYYNNKINRGNDNSSSRDDSTVEDETSLGIFDLSNSGTAINNSQASDLDNLLAKIVGGKTSGYANADFVGFMPNGQMTIFRTGGGAGFKAADNSVAGSYTDDGDTEFGNLDTLTLFGHTLAVTMDTTGNGFEASDGINKYRGYRGTDGLLYIDSDGDGNADMAYSMATNGDLLWAKTWTDKMDFQNYKALVNAGLLWATGDLANGRSRPDILANASVIEPLRAVTADTIDSILAVSGDDTMKKAAFIAMVNKYYNQDTTDGVGGADALPGADAANFFNNLGSAYSPLTIFSTGAFQTDNTYSGATQTATFENAAPLIFENLEHLFASVVAVGLTGDGTSGAGSVTGFSPSGKYALTQWTNNGGTPTNADDDKYYKARACGVAGTGTNKVDPWCFAAAGVTDEMAVASMAGAAGAIKSAFDYMTNKQLFALLALTADGPFLATGSDGKVMTREQLLTHLQAMYILPNDVQAKVDGGVIDYWQAFKETFGYGLINLERATKPNTKIYYYDGDKIVSGAGNAYWRSATNTRFRASTAFNPRAGSISAPFYDVLESIDGSLSLPRIWKNEFALGTSDLRALYMGDILGEFKIGNDSAQVFNYGNLSFELGMTEKAYVDNLGGLDNLKFGYTNDRFEMTARFQRHFTDGVSRFDGTANPILSLASNTVSTDFAYKMGNWSFGGRAFSGTITDENALDNDPTISNQYEPARLGMMQGAQTDVSWGNDKFALTATLGMASESDTILGAQTDGLLALGAGETTYIDTVANYAATDNLKFTVRATYANTHTDPTGEFILGMTDVESNAFSVGADVGKFSFAISSPLAVTSGRMRYAHAEYDVIEKENGDFELEIIDQSIRNLDLRPESREIRFSGSYRTQLGPQTDGAFGFIYRVNPNHITEFGNESILMMKIRHKVGI